MLRFFYNPRYKYTNRTLIDVSNDTSYRDIDYVNIDSPDTINGHIIYRLEAGENIPTYVVDQSSGRRYFVSGITPLSANQKFQISLLRDVLSEGDDWKNEKAYIEAGNATDYNKYKRWNLPFTNTKVKEERLNFSGDSSFFVFYANQQNVDASGNITETNFSVNMSDLATQNVTRTVSTYAAISGNEYFDGRTYYQFGGHNCRISFVLNDDIIYRFYTQNGVIQSEYTTDYYYGQPWASGGQSCMRLNIPVSAILNNVNSCKTKLETAINNFIDSYLSSNYNQISASQTAEIAGYVNQRIYIEDQPTKLYTLTDSKANYTLNTTLNNSSVATLITAIQNINFPFTSTENNYELTGNFFRFYYTTAYTHVYDFKLINTINYFNMSFPAFDSEGNIPKLPKSSVRCMNILSGAGDVDNNTIAQCLMLAQKMGGTLEDNLGQIIDVQFLPFSIATTNDANANININGVNQYAKVLQTDDFEFFTNLPDLTDINKETDTIKIISPSRTNQFLFRPYDNNGIMEFTTSVTVKPFASTIYVRPSTKGLLQYDWDDKDCLIVNEDFSLTKVNSAWADYVRSNKNYASIFNREIQGREYQRKWERKIEQAQARSDQYNARNAANQEGRNAVGNIPIVGTIAGLFSQGLSQLGGDNAYTRYMAAAQLDRQYNEALYRESISLSQDLFNFQLDNIQSQPSIPSTITTIDCKLLDGIYLEFYSTNPTEKAAIEEYYRNNGNRISSFGTFRNYYGNFVRGRLLYPDHYTQPETDEINRRLEAGIFTEVQYD